MLVKTESELASQGAFIPIQAPIIQRVAETIPYVTVPERMKLTIAVSEIMTYASQFRKNIVTRDGTQVPINSIAFVVTASGQNKDSSVRAARKCFTEGYKILTKKVKDLAVLEAKKLATEAGCEDPNSPEEYRKFYKDPAPIFMSPTTGPGFVQHINDLAKYPILAGLLYSGELADELNANPDMLENIKILSEVYDLGIKEVKYTKGIDSRSSAIDGQPVSALLVGSPTYILYDEATKKKFQIAFMSKLARRSWFCYIPDVLPEANYDTIDAMIEAEELVEQQAQESRDKLTSGILKVTEYNLAHQHDNISISKDVERLFKVYKRYNSELATHKLAPSSVTALVRKHLQWKALKLAGALAIFDCSSTIELNHYVEAIRFCEILSNDMNLFEAEMNKSLYERFADYMRTSADAEGKTTIDIHQLKKLGFISTAAPTIAKLKELITPAAVYDTSGIYSTSKDGTSIHYEAIIKTDVLPISFKPVDNSGIFNAIASGQPKDVINHQKSLVAMTTSYGLEVSETTFPDLANLLQGDYAYSPFRFRDGNRGKDYLYGSTTWLVLDIDDSAITHSEAHFMLEDINHHIALSSDASNHFKFRVLLQLDSAVDVDSLVWRKFFTLISEDLGLKADPVPQSQIFFSYSGREVLSTLDASPLPIRDYLMQAMESTPPPISKSYSTPQKQAMLADELTTFAYCFECPENGGGSRSMIRMAYHAKELGMSNDEIVALVHRANNYWTNSLPEARLEATILSQVRRFS